MAESPLLAIKTEPPDEDEDVDVGEVTEELLRDAIKDSPIQLMLKKQKKTKYGDDCRCQTCGKILADREGLRRHQTTHSSDLPFACSECPAVFARGAQRSRHEARVHRRLRPHGCAHCPKAFFTRSARDSHQMIHTGERPFVCQVCGKDFNRDHVLKAHMYTHTGEKPFVCSACGYGCRDQSTLRKHQARHTNTHKQYQCAVCSKRYDAKCKLKMHIASQHAKVDIRKYECDICAKKFAVKAVLAKHIQVVHVRLARWVCGVCDRSFTARAYLDNHAVSHRTERNYSCEKCHTWYKTKSNLQKHMITHAPARHACATCGRAFHRPGRLRSHERAVHRRSQASRCPLCPAKFYSQAYVKRHLERVHSDGARLECDVCGKTSRDKPGMISHLKIHNRTPAYPCPVCRKKFTLATLMKKHCHLQHGVRCSTRFKGPRKKIKQEPLDIHENELPDERSNERLSAAQAAARDVISRAGARRLSSVAEEHFEQFMVATVKPAKFTVKKRPGPSHAAPRPPRPSRVKSAGRAQTEGRPIRGDRPRRAAAALAVISALEEERSVPESMLQEKKRRARMGFVDPEKTKTKGIDRAPTIDNRSETKENAGAVTRRVKRKRSSIDKGGEEVEKARGARGRGAGYVSKCRIKFGTVQCYTCFKLFANQEELSVHCREHFASEGGAQVTKCPFCSYEGRPGRKGLWRHVRREHNVDLKVSSDVREKVDEATKERKYVLKFGTKSYKSKGKKKYDEVEDVEVEVVPSTKAINRMKSKEIDKVNRKKKLGTVQKRKLVRKGDSWVVVNEVVPVTVSTETGKVVDKNLKDLIANRDKEDLTNDLYLELMYKRGRKAKAEGKEILYPCDKCEKVCLAYCGLKTHRRVHNSKAKPFKPKVWKNRVVKNRSNQDTGRSNPEIDKLLKEDLEKKKEHLEKMKEKNRTQKARPILKKRYQCDSTLKQFFENNVTGEDVDFEHFLRIFRKVDKNNIEDLAEEMAAGNPVEEQTLPPVEKPKKKNIEQVRREIVLRKKAIKAKLRKEIASKASLFTTVSKVQMLKGYNNDVTEAVNNNEKIYSCVIDINNSPDKRANNGFVPENDSQGNDLNDIIRLITDPAGVRFEEISLSTMDVDLAEKNIDQSDDIKIVKVESLNEVKS